MLSRFQLATSILLAALTALVATAPASAQSPTPATTVKNGNDDVRLQLNYDGGFYVPGTFGPTSPADSIPATGAGTRMMWYPAKGAFRAGQVGRFFGATRWNASNVGDYSVAFGVDTKADGFAATAIGNATEALGDQATAMGSATDADGEDATAMGNGAVAVTDQSLTIGRFNDKNRGTDDNDPSTGPLFVVGNGDGSNLPSSRSDALVLDKSGNLSIDGVFEAGPTGSTFAGHFQQSKSSITVDRSDHITLVENTSTAGNSDALAIQTGPDTNPDTGNNFITFFDGDGDAIGAVEGNGSGGVDYSSGGADFAEELPVAAESAATPAAAEIVGVKGGQVSLATEQTDRVMITSTTPIMTGNATPDTEADDNERVAVAFVGQVPATVRGDVEIGDLIVASGKSDGTGRAVSPSEYRRSKHGPIAGQAWSAKETSEAGEVTVAVGLGRSGAVADQMENQRDRIDELETENEEIKKRLAALEAERSPSVVAGLVSSRTGLLLAFLLGGLLGAGLLWRHRG